MEKINNYITVDPAIQHGQPVFKGTRVPVETLFFHLEEGISINEFLSDFPTVSRQQVLGVLALAQQLFSSGKLNQLDEVIAG